MTNRPDRTALRHRFLSLFAAFACLTLVAGLAGCANPTFIGVQDYGTIIGNVVDSAGKPIGGALVSATGTSNTIRSNSDGSFSLPQVAAGTQSVAISAPGYGSATTSVLVTKDLTVSVNNITLQSTTNAPPPH